MGFCKLYWIFQKIWWSEFLFWIFVLKMNEKDTLLEKKEKTLKRERKEITVKGEK